MNTKVGCWEVAVLLLEDDALADVLSIIHGTATCLPLDPVALVAELGLVAELLELELVELLVAALALLDSERTANSSLPDEGFTIVSLIVPISVPEEFCTCAPVNWLTRTASWPIRPVALKCRLLQLDWLPEADPGVALPLG